MILPPTLVRPPLTPPAPAAGSVDSQLPGNGRGAAGGGAGALGVAVAGGRRARGAAAAGEAAAVTGDAAAAGSAGRWRCGGRPPAAG